MHAPRTLDTDESYGETEEQLARTWLFLQTCKLTKGMAPSFEKLLADLEKLRPAEIKLDRTVEAKEARVFFGDDDLNVLLDETKKGILAEVGNDCSAPLYRQIFGSQTPSELRRFVMSDQLEAMRTWPAILAQTSGRAPRLEDLEKAVTRHAERLARVTAQRDELAGKQARALHAKLQKDLLEKRAQLAEEKRKAEDAVAEVAALEAEMMKGKWDRGERH